MTEPSQYFKGRTVQEQMNEVIGYVDVRSAEVATNAIAADVAQVHQDMLDADADATAAAASAAAAAGTLANAVKKTGEASQSITGDIAISGNLSAGGNLAVTGNVTGGTVTVPTPVNNTDAASKKYVDDSLDNYASMVRTANAQTIAGVKTHTDNIVISKTNGKMVITDTRDISTMISASIAGGMSVSVKNSGSDLTLVTDEVRVSGFGVTGGVERMMWTYCKMPDDSIKSVILRVKIDPSTGKAQLLFGSNVISEVNL